MFRRIPRILVAGVLLGAFAMGGGVPAAAAPEADAELRVLRTCDPTGCYIVWRAVDSDRDGVCDADELVAGTDPFDPKSLPGMPRLVELSTAKALPSFEYGQAFFVVLPAKLIAIRGKNGLPTEGAFGVPARADTLTRMGVDLAQAARLGIKLEHGFTIGLDVPGKETGVPGRKVAGLNAEWISAGTGQQHGSSLTMGLTRPDGTTGHVTVNADGSSTVAVYDKENHTTTLTFENADGSPGGSKTTGVDEGDDMDVFTETTKDGDGKVVETVVTEVVGGTGWAQTYTVSKQFTYGSDGKVTGTTVTTTTTTHTQFGSTSAQTVKSCDAGGKCTDITGLAHGGAGGHTTVGGGSGHGGAEGHQTPPATTDAPADHDDGAGHGGAEDSDDPADDTEGDEDDDTHGDPDGDHGYIESDYAGPVFVTREVVAGVLRTRGAAVNVVQGWTAPGMDGSGLELPDPGVIMLVNPDDDSFFLLAEPDRVTTAQPEGGRPDMPNPVYGAPPVGGCNGLC